jgi:MFS family permease
MAFAVAFVVGSMGTLFDSGLQSFIPMALSDEQLPTVNGGIEFVRNLAMAVGFIAAGEILERYGGFSGAFAFDGVTYVVSVMALVMIRQVRRRPRPQYEPMGRALAVGLGYLWRTRPLRWATVAAVATNFAFAPLAAVLVLYAEVELGIAADDELGRFFAVFSLIAAGFGMVAPAAMRRFGVGRSVILGGFLFGTGALAAGIVPGWWAVIPFGILTGGVAINQSAFVTLRQRLTPPDRLGRVIAASRTAAFAGLPLGAYFGAVLGDSIGLRPLFIAGGTVIAIVSLLLVTGPLGNRDHGRLPAPPGYAS